MGEQKKNKLLPYLIFIPIVIIATCNIILNTKKENEDKAIVKNPSPGDYYIFYREGSMYNLPLKAKEVTSGKIIFYFPNYELGVISNDREKFQSVISRKESKNELYGNATLEISRKVLDSMTDKSIDKKKYQVSEGLVLGFVDSYKGYHK